MYQSINDFTWKRDQRTPEIWFLCSQPDSIPASCKDGKKIAFADPDPYPYTWNATKWLPSSGIGFCSSFFGDQLVNEFLFTKSTAEWCKGKTFGDYLNSGFFTIKLLVSTDAYGCKSSFTTPQTHCLIDCSISRQSRTSNSERGWTVSQPAAYRKKNPILIVSKLPSFNNARCSYSR
jgi:hypothetical protein